LAGIGWVHVCVFGLTYPIISPLLQVDHFSKYKLQENASDDEGDQQHQTQQLKQQQQQHTQQLPPTTDTANMVGIIT